MKQNDFDEAIKNWIYSKIVLPGTAVVMIVLMFIGLLTVGVKIESFLR